MLIGGAGNDSLVGGSGDDEFRLFGNDVGNDYFDGGDDSDTISVYESFSVSQFLLDSAHVKNVERLRFSYNSQVTGTNGNDKFDISGVGAVSNYYTFELGEGNDRFTGHIGDDYVNGGTGVDTLIGAAGDDLLIGGAGNDSLVGGSGDDTFRLFGNDVGNDYFIGGDGTDTISVYDSFSTSRFLLDGAHAKSIEWLSFDYGESVSGTNGRDVFNISAVGNVSRYATFNLREGNDSFVGHSGDDYVDAGAGNDTLRGGAGDDRLNGGAGADLLLYTDARSGVRVNLSLTDAQEIGGGRGFDTLSNIEHVIGSAFADRLAGNGSANTLRGGAGRDTLLGGGGNDLLDGGQGFDFAGYAGANSGVNVSLAITKAQFAGVGQGMDRFVSIEGLEGSRFGDRLIGNANANILSGAAGNDTLTGAAGADTLNGGAGKDVLIGGAGNDFLNGGAGVDTASYTGSIAVTVNLGNLNAQNTGYGRDILRQVENVIGGNAGDRLTGNAASNTLTGNGGKDILNGAAGNDTLFGGAGNDVLNGGAGHDVLIGGIGSDRLIGGTGSDRLTGDTGADAFVFQARGGTDRVLDFVRGSDVIEINWEGRDYADLDIRYANGDAIIEFAGSKIIVEDIRALSASDFDFI